MLPGIGTLVDPACALSNVQLSISAETSDLGVRRSLVRAGTG